MVICLAFRDCKLHFLWLEIVYCLHDCDWLVFCGIVICLALRNNDSLVGWITIVIRFLSCDCNLPALSLAIVIRLLLRGGDSLGWSFLVAVVDLPCDSDSIVVRLVKCIRHLVVIIVFLGSWCFACDCSSAFYFLVLILKIMIIIF